MRLIIRKTSASEKEREERNELKTKRKFVSKKDKEEEETIEYNKYTRKLKGNLIFTLALYL